jgi:hypothetical protein
MLQKNYSAHPSSASKCSDTMFVKPRITGQDHWQCDSQQGDIILIPQKFKHYAFENA